MASRQPNYNTLGPVDQREQEKWAQSQLKKNSGKNACDSKILWFRTLQDGYVCGEGTVRNLFIKSFSRDSIREHVTYLLALKFFHFKEGMEY